MRNKIGVIQGRLLPKYQNRYQAFPVGMWKEEFTIAKDNDLDLIEFILDYNDAAENPLLKKGGIDEIKTVIEKTGVNVQTICADYFMDAPLHSKCHEIVQSSQQVLLKLIENANKLGVTDIVIPCVDNSSLFDLESKNRFVDNINPIIKQAEINNINLSLETDLEAKQFQNLLKRFRSNRITVNYDTGNSASLGYNFLDELDTYGKKITDIHIKDRSLGGGPVILGEGNADFENFFKKLKTFNYSGPFIMQTYRDDEGLDIFKRQFKWIKDFFKNFSQ